MRNRAHDVASYSFSAGEPLLLDTNVWLFLFPAPSSPNPSFAAKYSSALKEMLAAGARLLLDALVLSEYVNRYCRIQFEALFRGEYEKFKDFRRSSDFPPIGGDAVVHVRHIMALCTRQDNGFAVADVESALQDFESGFCDINDALLIDQCRRNGWKMVTDDADCTEGGIEVLTGNPRLLDACSRA